MNNLSKNYINGQWVDWNGDTIDVHEAGTGEVIAKVPASDREAMEQAIAAADAAPGAGMPDGTLRVYARCKTILEVL